MGRWSLLRCGTSRRGTFRDLTLKGPISCFGGLGPEGLRKDIGFHTECGHLLGLKPGVGIT